MAVRMIPLRMHFVDRLHEMPRCSGILVRSTYTSPMEGTTVPIWWPMAPTKAGRYSFAPFSISPATTSMLRCPRSQSSAPHACVPTSRSIASTTDAHIQWGQGASSCYLRPAGSTHLAFDLDRGSVSLGQSSVPIAISITRRRCRLFGPDEPPSVPRRSRDRRCSVLVRRYVRATPFGWSHRVCDPARHR